MTMPAMAYHIVGGEIEFEMVLAGEYRINLVQYFDAASMIFEMPDPIPYRTKRSDTFFNEQIKFQYTGFESLDFLSTWLHIFISGV